MRELILNPISITLILFVLLLYSLLIYELTSRRSVKNRLDKPLMVLSFIGMLPFIYPPFFFIHPQRLCTGNLSLTGALTTFILWVPIVFILKRISFPNFPKDAFLIFKDPLLIILIGMSMASSLWSQTSGITFRSSLALVVMAILASHIIKKYSWSEIERFVRLSLTVVTPISVLFTFALGGAHPYGEPWGGTFLNARSFGGLMCLSTGLWFAIAIYKGRILGIEMLISIASLLLVAIGGGKSQIISALALIYMILVLKLFTKFRFRQSVVVVIIMTLVTAALFFIANASLDLILEILGKDRSLTGRAEFWPQLIGEVLNHPIGFGYNGFWQSWRGAEDPSAFIGSGTLIRGDYRPPHSHNGFLEVALQLGVVGFIIFMFSFLKTTLLAIWHQQFFKGPEAIFPLIIIVFLIVSNLAETEPQGLIGPNYAAFFYMLITLKLGTVRQQLRAGNQQFESVIP